MTQTPFEKQMLSEAEIEIRKNVEDLVKWLDGSLKYFVRSIKGLSELTKNKEMFKSYVTMRILDNLEKLSEVADLYDKDEETDDTPDTNLPEDEVKKFFLNAGKIDYEDLTRYYTSEILSILATNTDTLDSMRLRISMLHFISFGANEFGHAVLDYITHRVLMAQTMDMSGKIAVLLCLMTAVRDHKFEEYGEYADVIKDIVDDMTLPVCMAITKDYELANTPEETK